jgi:hypothetical protein
MRAPFASRSAYRLEHPRRLKAPYGAKALLNLHVYKILLDLVDPNASHFLTLVAAESSDINRGRFFKGSYQTATVLTCASRRL